jgi:hypothetical protein
MSRGPALEPSIGRSARPKGGGAGCFRGKRQKKDTTVAILPITQTSPYFTTGILASFFKFV